MVTLFCIVDLHMLLSTALFRLSVCYISRLCRGRHVPSLFFSLLLLVSVLFIFRAMCAWLSVTVDALCSWREQCVTRGVRADVV